MKISVITTTYNSGRTVRDTIESVLSQDYPDIEYIIIDGASTDDTLRIVNEYADRISWIVSEPDKGIYDAMNKGIRMATGDVVGILNSDDFFCFPGCCKPYCLRICRTLIGCCVWRCAFCFSGRFVTLRPALFIPYIPASVDAFGIYPGSSVFLCKESLV